MKTLCAALLFALLLLPAAWAAPASLPEAPMMSPAVPAEAQTAILFPETTEGTEKSGYCNVWCPSPPYAMSWFISCEATYCGTEYMICVGGYSQSCSQCQTAWQTGSPEQCLY